MNHQTYILLTATNVFKFIISLNTYIFFFEIYSEYNIEVCSVKRNHKNIFF